MKTYSVTIFTSVEAETDLLARIKILDLVEEALNPLGHFEIEIEEDHFYNFLKQAQQDKNNG